MNIDLIIYFLGLFGVIFICFVVQLAYKNYDKSWQSKITAEDIEELKKIFEREYNDC